MKQHPDTESALLSRLNRHSGMTVPEGYFESFAQNMSDIIQEKPWEKINENPNGKILPAPEIWNKIKPYA